LDITDAVSDQGIHVEVHTITTGDGDREPVFDESSDSDLDSVGSRVVDESSISMQEETPGLPFTMPRHFCFTVDALKTLAPKLVQQQNSEAAKCPSSSVLKQYNDRGYDVNTTPLQYVYPEAYDNPTFQQMYNSLSPCIKCPDADIGVDSIKWFFTALTTLFPGAMLLSPGLFTFKCPQNQGQKLSMSDWKAKFTSRRPYAVLHPAHMPKDPTKPLSIHDNPGYHWVLIVIQLTWNKQRAVSSAVSLILDPFNNEIFHKGASDTCNQITQALELSNVQATPHDPNFTKLQAGGNHHCAVFTMALGLNFLTQTLHTMGKHLIVKPNDTFMIGLELRKMVAWDCKGEPAMLNACLAMSPAFHGLHYVDYGHLQPFAHEWWRVTHTHDVVAALFLQPELRDGGLFSPYRLDRKNKLKENFAHDPDFPERTEKVPTDGPFFYMNDRFFVKVYCIGLIEKGSCMEFVQGNDTRSISRAASAFNDSSATSCVCGLENWWACTFGLICVGFSCPCAFICVARKKLTELPPDKKSAEAIGKFASDFTAKYNVLHNDVHPGNVMMGSDEMQFVDCERTSKVSNLDKDQSKIFHTAYCTSIISRTEPVTQFLLRYQIEPSGLGATHFFFSQYYTGGTFLHSAFEREMFNLQSPSTPWRYNSLLHLMHLLFEKTKTLPRLLQSDKSLVIFFDMRMHYQSEEEKTYECKIFFAVRKDTKDGFEVLNCDHPLPSFRDNFTALNSAWVLNSAEQTTAFFYNALSLFAPDLPESDEFEPDSREGESDDLHSRDIPSGLSRKKLPKRPKTAHSTDPVTVATDLATVALDRQFNFLAKSVSGDVFKNCVSSIKLRFSDYKVRAEQSRSHTLTFAKNVLDYTHLGVRVSVVSNLCHANKCIDFIKSQTVLTIDTETAYPRFPEQGALISLMQIGTNHRVFLIQVAQVAKALPTFFETLKIALGGKLLVHWGGNDKNDVSRVLGGSPAVEWCDLQARVSQPLGSSKGTPGSSKGTSVPSKGLDDCVNRYLKGVYSLSKEWTLSGWDLDILHDRQIDYAALDVASCHLIYLHHELQCDVFQCSTLNFHSFFTPRIVQKGSPVCRHGLSFEADRCCHYELGTLVRGLFYTSNSNGSGAVIPKGFSQSSQNESFSESLIVPSFADMLNVQKFCCCICFDLKWFEKIGFACAQFRFRRGDLTSFTCQRGKGSARTVTVQFPSSVGSQNIERQAFFCLSMLGSFLNINLRRVMDYTKLVDSVRYDCSVGFIRRTLSFLDAHEFIVPS
jgi:hypothetical protein